MSKHTLVDEMTTLLEDFLAFCQKPAGFKTAMLLTDEEFGEFLRGLDDTGEQLKDRAWAAIAKAKATGAPS